MSTIIAYDRVGYGLNLTGGQFFGIEETADWNLTFTRAIDTDTLEYRVTGSAIVYYQLISFTYNASTRIITFTDVEYQNSNRLPLLSWSGINIQASIDSDGLDGSDFFQQIDSGVTVYGNSFNDFIDGGSSADYLYGLAGNDTINGGGGNDTLVGGIGNDILDGSLGIDLALYGSFSAQHTTTLSASAFSMQGSPLSYGRDTLTSVEKIQFSDMTIETSWFLKTESLSTAQRTSLTELYIASFNRAPDAIGLNYWGGRLYDGMSLAQIAKSFFVQPETVAAYPGNMPTRTFVTTVYDNVLSRAPDTDGLNYWVREIDTGNVTKDVFLLAIINGAKASTGSPTDRQTLSNKVTVGNYFAFDKGINNTTWGIDVMDSVTSVASTVTAANTLTDSYSAAIIDTTAPTVSSFSPTDGVTNVAVNDNVVITFDEAIARGTGNIVLRSGSATGLVVETFDAATSTRLTISGSTLTIDPTSNLTSNTQYFLTIASGSIKDIIGNNYAGTTTYDFRTKAPITGTSGNDTLTGTATSDAINGLAGDDIISGGAGNDVTDGGDGSDVYIITDVSEHVTAEVNDTGASGTDSIRFAATAAGTLNLYASDTGLEAVWIGTGTGPTADFTGTLALNVDASRVLNSLALFGNGGANSLTGTSFDDILYGLTGDDTLIGGAANDVLLGNVGNDSLIGGTGSDGFVFSSVPNSATNVDFIVDFSRGEDTIWLGKADFTAFSSATSYSTILPSQFWSGASVATAHDADDRILYNTTTGALYYDADGTGLVPAIQFATITSVTKPILAHTDFYVI